MSSKLNVKGTQENVTERVLLKRLKNEAKKRNCSVVLHKAKLPRYGYYNVCTGESDDQQVPNVTDMLTDVIPAWLPSPSDGDELPAGGACTTNHEPRNIFQSIKSFSGYDYRTEENGEKPSTGLQAAPADSLFLTDLGTTLSDPTKEGGGVNTAMDSVIFKGHVNAEGEIMKKEHVEEVDLEEEVEDKWCPLTPTSESERDTVTSINIPDDGIVDYSQPNLDDKTNSGSTLLIKECWSLAGKESFWSNPSDATIDCNQTNKYSTSTSPDYVNDNNYTESNSAKQTSAFNTEVTCLEVVQSTQDAVTFEPEESTFHQEHSDNEVQSTQDAITFVSEESTFHQEHSDNKVQSTQDAITFVSEESTFHQKNSDNEVQSSQDAITFVPEESTFHQEHSDNDGDVKTLQRPCEVTDQCVIQTTKQTFSDDDAKQVYSSSDDVQETTDSIKNNMLTTPKEKPQVKLSEIGKEQFITTGSPVAEKTLAVTPTQYISLQQSDYNKNYHSNTEMNIDQHLATSLSNSESDRTIEQLHSMSVGNIATSMQTFKATEHSSPSSKPSTAANSITALNVDRIARVPETSQNMETIPMSPKCMLDNNQNDGDIEKSKCVAGVNLINNRNETSQCFFNKSNSDTLVGKIQQGNTEDNSTTQISTKDEKLTVNITKPDSLQTSLEIGNKSNANTSPNQSNETPYKRPRGRPKGSGRSRGRGRGRGGYGYGHGFMRQEIPFHHTVNFNNPMNTCINNISQSPQQNPQKVIVPIELPSKGVIGLVSQTTYSEIQKHLSASDSVVPNKPEQNQPVYQGLSHEPHGRICVPIYDSDVLKFVQKTISNGDSTLQTPMQIHSNSHRTSTVQTSEPNQMIELQRPPPGYQPTLHSNINNDGAYQSTIENNLPVAVNEKEMNRNCFQVENESVLALPRNSITNLPVPISIPKSKYNRKGSNIKGSTTLTVREQLLEKMRGRLYQRRNFTGTTPRLQQPSLVTNAPIFHMLSPRPPHPSSIPNRKGIFFSPVQQTHSISQEIRSNPPFPVYRPSTKISPQVSFNQSFVATPQYHFQSDPQKPVSHTVVPIETGVVNKVMNNSLVSNSVAMFTTHTPHFQTSNAPPQVTIIDTSRPAPRHNAVQLRKPEIHSSKQQNNFHSHNLFATRQLQAINIQPQQTFSALDLSMRSKDFHNNVTVKKPEENYSAPLDLSRKPHPTVENPDVKCTPLDLSQKEQDRPAKYLEPVVQSPDLNGHEGMPQQSSVSSESLRSVSDVEPEQSLSVLAAAAELLEYKHVSTGDVDPPDQQPSPKMEKIKVKFNSKQKLWHLVPMTKDLQKHTGQKPKRGRPPIVKNIEENTVVKRHHCQFCNFSHIKKHEVRVHIKVAHFAKFKKDPKNNDFHQDDVEKIRIKNPPENQDPNPTKNHRDFMCKHCGFKTTSSYILQLHIAKCQPNETSDVCQSIEREIIEELKKQRHTCNICGATYLYINGLRSHEHRHHLLLAHQCLKCGLKFKSKGTLQRHQIQKNHLPVKENESVSSPGV
ncbi:uncharacterized protein LOC117119030 [Anneissia japonica]|uniref:uncharacterized protein LOC117119030 n=1 Tax=Anneissia japonica TaxID=1529436 RepID=UPI001425B7B7|nr:uncharacterized protein LOC117119030 [Anneissia japonica]XP_033119719.1 uncharacterized protein LOC117119030 [Anneissia japonica]XP_033119720.1 uncharacterized protein LOC117119030 [Anneissia japonica]XP_033119721.1 uncharacterized protein LOC117119030 [Anneissia japonica]XP_033119723.1 uncharacterized protein LOC117119030 [Anneissia japonica]XP_033119724.1 uncharacterized protein LOC117119030 [Anneissia japonica]XP_033119725.1 uncharacterized protein LOC117119030 [Anneissia japonica]XP_0